MRDRILGDEDRRDLRLVFAWIAAVVFLLLALGCGIALAHDDGKFANSPLKTWFDQLASGKGLCCSFADGVSIEDVDWDSYCVPAIASLSSMVCHYRVRLNKQWIDVPPKAVVTEPNKFGPAVVWPYQDMNGMTQIRCFIPGAGA